MLPKVIQTNLALLHHPAEKPTSEVILNGAESLSTFLCSKLNLRDNSVFSLAAVESPSSLLRMIRPVTGLRDEDMLTLSLYACFCAKRRSISAKP